MPQGWFSDLGGRTLKFLSQCWRFALPRKTRMARPSWRNQKPWVFGKGCRVGSGKVVTCATPSERAIHPASSS